MRRVIKPTPANRTKESMREDLMHKDVLFAYQMTKTEDSMGSQVETLATVPYPLPASVQEAALDSQPVEPGKEPTRYIRIRTRQRNGLAWHDHVVCRGARWQVIKVEEKFANYTGQFQYLEARALFHSEAGSVNGL